MESVQVGVEISCHMVRGNGGRGRVLCIRTDQHWVPVNGERLIPVNNEGALVAAAHCDATCF